MGNDENPAPIHPRIVSFEHQRTSACFCYFTMRISVHTVLGGASVSLANQAGRAPACRLVSVGPLEWCFAGRVDVLR
jgi:hypothetical protein